MRCAQNRPTDQKSVEELQQTEREERHIPYRLCFLPTAKLMQSHKQAGLHSHGELRIFTGRQKEHREPTALLLIRIVPTVVVVVALPAAGHAAVVLAAELVRFARSLVCAQTGRVRPRRATSNASCLRGRASPHRTRPWVRRRRRCSPPRRRTSRAPGCSGPSPCSGTRPRRTSSELRCGGGGRKHFNRLASKSPFIATVLFLKAHLTAVGGLIRAIHAVVVPVTDPDPRDAALTHGTLELVGSTCDLRYGSKGHI